MDTLLVAPTAQHDMVDTLRGLLRARPYFQAAELLTPERVADSERASWPPLAFVATDEEHSDTALACLRVLRERGVKHLLAVGPATDPKLILRALQSGADLFLDQADLELELELALSRLQLRQTAGAGRPRQVIAVLSAAGGCGASTLAVNVAALIAQAHGQCNLIELSAGKADLAPLLDLRPQYTLADLCRNDGRLDRSLYEKLLTRHASGVALLAAPAEYGGAEAIGPRGVARALTLAREAFADVVVDVQDCRPPERWVAIEQATRILLVVRPDFTSVRSARRLLDYLVARDIPADRVEVVLNQTGLPNEILTSDAEAAIGRPVELFVPHDADSVNAANNTGVPITLSRPQSEVAQGFAGVVGMRTPSARWSDRLRRLAADAPVRVATRVRAFFGRFAPRPATPPPSGRAVTGGRTRPTAERYAIHS